MRTLALLLFAALCAAPFTGCRKEQPPPMVQLKVDSAPAGATVSLDGQPLGKTPLQKAVPPGNHLLEVALAGHETAIARFQGQAPGEAPFSFPLRPVTAAVLIESTPAGAALTVAGEDKGKTPVLMPQLPYGSYECSVAGQGFAPKKFRIRVDDARPQRLMQALDSVTCELEIVSETPQAEVFLNDKAQGITTGSGEPLLLQNVVAGDYSMTVRKEGYKPFTQQLTLERQKRRTVQIPALQGLPGALEVSSTPPGADVCNTKGDVLGTTPCRIADLPAGGLTVTLRKRGYEEAVRTVRMTAGADQQVAVLLTRSLGDISFSTDPAGISVLLDNQPAGTTTAAAFLCRDLPPGRHILALHHPDYETLTSSVSVEKGQTRNLGLLKLKKRWVPTHSLKMANGAVTNGVLISTEADGSIVFETTQGIKTTYKPSEFSVITALPKKPAAPAPE